MNPVIYYFTSYHVEMLQPKLMSQCMQNFDVGTTAMDSNAWRSSLGFKFT